MTVSFSVLFFRAESAFLVASNKTRGLKNPAVSPAEILEQTIWAILAKNVNGLLVSL